jgi:hypothetical protein
LFLQIKDIFSNIGVQMTGETLEHIYTTIAKGHPKGHVSVESFRNALDEEQARLVALRQHPMII